MSWTTNTDRVMKEYNSGKADVKKALENIFGESRFTPITDRVTCFEDACKELGINYLLELDRMKNMQAHEIAYCKLATIVKGTE
jgi:hypothetical protein